MTHRSGPNQPMRRSRRALLAAAGASLLGGCIGTGGPTPSPPTEPTESTGTPEPTASETTAPGTPEPTATIEATPTAVASTADGVDAYSSWLQSALDVQRERLPEIVEAADAAAERYVGTDAPMAVGGDPSIAAEAYVRAGGPMPLEEYWTLPGSLTGGPAILVVGLREDQFDDDGITDKTLIAAANDSGDRWTVVGIGRQDLLDRAADDGVEWAGRVPTPAAPNEGLFSTANSGHLVPTSPPMTAVGLWTWTGEFVAACTRRGEMPPMYLAFSQEGGKERENRLGDQRFHDEAPDPIDPQLLGGRYLDAVSEIARTIHAKERSNMIAGADRLVAAHEADGRDWGFYHGHAMVVGQANYPHGPGDPRQINPGKWFVPSIEEFSISDLGPEDAILCIGYNSRFAGWEKWVNDEGVAMDEQLRSTGADLIWSFALREDTDDAAVLDENDERLIDQHWPVGDAVVDVPGYDIPILPASGVTSHQVHRTVQAGMLPHIESDVRALPR